MNLKSNPTIEELRELVKQCDDSAGHHVLWVNKAGEVLLSRIPEGLTPVGFEEAHKDMQMRLETFQAGNEYVGPEAAVDNEWISELFEALVKKWPIAKEKEGKARVEYIDQF